MSVCVCVCVSKCPAHNIHVHVCDSSFLFLRFGFVTFEDMDTAEKMIRKHDGADIDGFQISLRFAEDRNRGGGGGGGRTPDFGGRGRGGRGRGQFTGRQSTSCI